MATTEIDKAIFKFAIDARNIIYKWERHLDNPSDPRFPPLATGEEAYLEQIFDYFAVSITPAPNFEFLPKASSYENFKVYLQDQIIDNFENVSGSNMPPTELVKLLEEHEKHVQEKLALAQARHPTLASGRIKLIDSLAQKGLDREAVSKLVNEDLVVAEEAYPPMSLPQIAEAIADIAKISAIEIPPSEMIAILSEDDLLEVISSQDQDFNEIRQHVSQTIAQSLGSEVTPAVQTLSNYVVVGTAIGLKSTLPQITTAQLESALLISRKQGPNSAKILDVSQAYERLLTSPTAGLNQITSQIEEVMAHQHRVRKEFQSRVALSGLDQEGKQVATEVFNLRIAPVLQFAAAFGANDAEKKAGLSPIEKVLARMGLAEYRKGRRVYDQAYTAVYSWFEGQDFGFAYTNTAPSVQAFNLSRRGGPASEVFRQLYLLGQDKLTDKVTQLAVEKFGASAIGQKIASAVGAKLGTAAATGTLEAGAVAVGVATGPPGWLIAAATIAAGFIKDAISNISRWIRENWPKVAAAAAALVGALFGGLGVPVALAAGTIGWMGGAAVSPGGLSRFGSGASRFFNGVTTLAVTEIATPLIVITLITAPIMALFMFIINNSAYIVPLAEGELGGTSLEKPGGVIAHCSEISGTKYCFPVSPLEGVNFPCSHHDYRAIDIFTNNDQPPVADDQHLAVVAYIGGTIYWISTTDSAGGNAFNIKGDDGRFYYYAHNLVNYVALNQRVETGEVIALTDTTGNAVGTWEHLHFGISSISDMRTGRDLPRNIYNRNISSMIGPVAPGGGGDFKDKLDISCPQFSTGGQQPASW